MLLLIIKPLPLVAGLNFNWVTARLLILALGSDFMAYAYPFETSSRRGTLACVAITPHSSP
jgi:hypothetical protein